MRNIVFFGGGNITQAIIKGLIKGGFERNNIFYIDRNNKNQKILSKLKIKNLKNHRSAKIDLFILAVKPKDALIAYCEILKNYKNPKIVSFVAGIESKKYLNIMDKYKAKEYIENRKNDSLFNKDSIIMKKMRKK